jgi:hypothetical protein
VRFVRSLVGVSCGPNPRLPASNMAVRDKAFVSPLERHANSALFFGSRDSRLDCVSPLSFELHGFDARWNVV